MSDNMKFPKHKAGLFLTHNEHKDYYQSAEDWLKEQISDSKDPLYSWESEEAMVRAIATDSIWVLHWYPDTPIGFYCIAAPTLEELLAYAETFTTNDIEAQ